MDSTLSSRLGDTIDSDGVITKVVHPPFLRTPFNYDTDAASNETALTTVGPSLTQQQFRDETDINTIVRNFGLTGQLPENGAYPTYGDFDQVNDYQTAANMVRAADEAFMQLPAEVRVRFNHDPQRLMEFCDNPANLEEARKLGLTRTLNSPPPPPSTDPIPQTGIPPRPGSLKPDGTLVPD